MSHKNKTLSTLFATCLGSIGIHRFYLHGMRDKWGWLHFSSLPLSLVLKSYYFGSPALLTMAPLAVSSIISLLESLVLGLMPDEKWDARFNPGTYQASKSSWVLALILVLTVATGAIAIIAMLARAFDLLYTGGAYG